jgi:hypothetical protein
MLPQPISWRSGLTEIRFSGQTGIRTSGWAEQSAPVNRQTVMQQSGFPALRTDRIAGLIPIRDMVRQTVILLHRLPGRRLPWNAVLREYRNNLAAIAYRSRELQHGFPVLRADGIAGSTPVKDMDRQTVLPLHRLAEMRLQWKAVVPEGRRPGIPQQRCHPLPSIKRAATRFSSVTGIWHNGCSAKLANRRPV